MLYSSLASLLDLDLHPAAFPMLRVDGHRRRAALGRGEPGRAARRGHRARIASWSVASGCATRRRPVPSSGSWHRPA